MEFQDPTIYLAFLAGVLSFLSPCVLPLIPSYVSFISGISFEELTADNNPYAIKKTVIFNSLLFMLGFSVVFIAMGAAMSLLGQYFAEYKGVIQKVGGIIIIFFGLHIIGILNVKTLQRDKRFHFFHSKQKPLGFIGSFLVGLGFAAGWTPCIGPILASIILVAGTSETFGFGLLLLVVYSLGLAVPFFFTSLGINTFLKYFDRFKKHMRAISIASGVLLITMGLLIYTNYFAIFTGYLNAWFPFLVFN
jgi:cytochrome c-type biogenesis protein